MEIKRLRDELERVKRGRDFWKAKANGSAEHVNKFCDNCLCNNCKNDFCDQCNECKAVGWKDAVYEHCAGYR